MDGRVHLPEIYLRVPEYPLSGYGGSERTGTAVIRSLPEKLLSDMVTASGKLTVKPRLEEVTLVS